LGIRNHYHVLAIDELIRVDLLVMNLAGQDQAGAARQHLARHHRPVDCDREVALKEAHGSAAPDEARHPPVRQERQLPRSVVETAPDDRLADLPLLSGTGQR